jgi:transcriptional regulator with XRE-family HTH domain
MFMERIKQLCTKNKTPQQQLAVVLEIDTATYCKIEKGERKTGQLQAIAIDHLLQTYEKKLLRLWFVKQVAIGVEDDRNLSNKELIIVEYKY